MDINKKIKKSAPTLTLVILAMLVLIIGYVIMFNWLNYNAQNAGVNVESKYSNYLSNVSEVGTDLRTNIDSIKTNVEGLKEADSTWQVAWNGLKGLGNTLKLPITFLNSGLKLWWNVDNQIDFIDYKTKRLIEAGIIIFLVLLIVALLKGENRL